ncbi:hypothetical protein [Megasphaera elsdenii]|uniref:hypothetical protein n=1 Tax=Megasphaera elsdenii TaxID=907 RepID=UPI00242D9EC1|nr:hypothetical protein [Megasphaera elsdenii]
MESSTADGRVRRQCLLVVPTYCHWPIYVSPWSTSYTGEEGPLRADPDGQRRRDPMSLAR